MSLRQVSSAVLVLFFAVAGLVAKVHRYSYQLAGADTSLDPVTFAVLAGRGWTGRQLPPDATHPFYRWRFEKPGCSAPMVVSIIGRTPELRSYVEALAAGDVVFVSEGLIVSSPRPRLGGITELWTGGLGIAPGKTPASFYGISPASRLVEPACRLPFEAKR
jgi:hypothetical protein